MSDIKMIMERNPTSRSMELWACRGEGKGCARNKYRNSAKHCADCILAKNEETLEQLQRRIERGDG